MQKPFGHLQGSLLMERDLPRGRVALPPLKPHSAAPLSSRVSPHPSPCCSQNDFSRERWKKRRNTGIGIERLQGTGEAFLTVSSVFEDGEAVMFLGLEAVNVRWSFASTFLGRSVASLVVTQPSFCWTRDQIQDLK